MQLFIRLPYDWSYYISRRRVSPRGPHGPWENGKRLRAQIEERMSETTDSALRDPNCVAPAKLRVASAVFLQSLLPFFLKKQDPVIDDDDHVQTMRHDLYKNQDIELFVPEGTLAKARQWLKQMIWHLPTRAPAAAADGRRATSRESLRRRSSSRQRLHAARADLLSARAGRRHLHLDDRGAAEPFYSILLLSYLPERKDGFEQFAEFIGKGFVRLFHARLHWGKVFPLALAQENVVELSGARAVPRALPHLRPERRLPQRLHGARAWALTATL
jgi:hypothetical protein